MDWIKSFQHSIDYIEENLTEPADISKIAAQMNLSPFYYQKIFSIVCGITPGEYIRLRRLSLAGIELLSSDEKIIDIALKYGYDTPEGFTRAFTKFHCVSPSAVRKGAPIKSFERLSVAITMKGGSVMDYKIIKKPAFKVMEKRTVQTVAENKNLSSIPKLWEECHADGTVKKLVELTPDNTFIYGICYNNPHEEASTFEYSIAALADDKTKVPEGFTLHEIPARTWAVFECKGAMPDAMQELWHKICTEFFPSSDYEPTYEMDIEAYPSGEMNSADYRSEVWVPIKA